MRVRLSRRFLRGQNVIEYVLLVMAVVIVLIAGVLKGGAPGNGVEGAGPFVAVTKKVMSAPKALIDDSRSDLCKCSVDLSQVTCGQFMNDPGCPFGLCIGRRCPVNRYCVKDASGYHCASYGGGNT